MPLKAVSLPHREKRDGEGRKKPKKRESPLKQREKGSKKLSNFFLFVTRRIKRMCSGKGTEKVLRGRVTPLYFVESRSRQDEPVLYSYSCILSH